MPFPFPFFVGSDRSGTTLFRLIFDAHPDLSIPYESWFIPPLLRARSQFERSSGFDVGAFVEWLSGHERFRRWELTNEAVRSRLAETGVRNVPSAIRELFALYASSRGKPRYGDKTPAYVRYLDVIGAAFPEARFIHVIRDGRDVALSLVEARWGPGTIADAAYMWKRRVSGGRRMGAALGSRYREVRYEDLLADPPTVIAELCTYLDLNFDQRMLEHDRNASEALAAAKFPEMHRNAAQPITQGLRRWRDQMAPADIATFEAYAGDLLASLGYERALEKPPLAEVMRARGHELREYLRRDAPRPRRARD